VGSHGFAGGDVFVVHGKSVGEQGFLDFREACSVGLQLGEERLHAVDGPEEIHRCRSRSGEDGADVRELGGELLGGCGVGLLRSEGDAEGGGDADGRRAADDHGYDHVGHLAVAGGENVGFFQWELGLVDKPDAFRGPFEGKNHPFQCKWKCDSALCMDRERRRKEEYGTAACCRGVRTNFEFATIFTVIYVHAQR